MLNNSFWILPCGINTGSDIVSCGFSSAAQCYVLQTGSVNWVRVLRVNKWEALEFFLVQVGYKLLIWGGQLWGVACEKAIKVLSVTPTLRWREKEMEKEREGWGEDGMNMMEWGMSRKNGHQTNKEEKKRKTTKTNQSNQSQPRLWISIGPYESQWHLSIHHWLLHSQVTGWHLWV